MTEQEWIAQANRDRELLISLIKNYHPANRQPGRRPSDFITAPSAESACTVIRKDIKEKYVVDPVEAFNGALDKGDLNTVNLILNEAWFGVPESQTCWGITGFNEAVALMEDLPEMEE